MNNIGKRLMPSYLIKFMERVYQGTLPTNMGKRMVSRQFIAKIQSLYDRLDGNQPSNYSRRMVSEYLIEEFGDVDYVEYSSENLAYTVATPEGALRYAEVNEVGGASKASDNKLILINISQQTRDGVTFTPNGEEGSVKLNGTATNNQYSCFATIYQNENGFPNGIKAGDTIGYRLFGNDLECMFTIYVRDNNSWTQIVDNGYASSVEIPSNATGVMVRVAAKNATTYNNKIVYPMLVKGTTAPSEFKVGFEGIRDSAVTAVNELTIPAEVQALDGYGYGINSSVYNYIDYDNKKFVQKVARVDLGSLTWTKRGGLTNVTLYSASNFTDYKFSDNVNALVANYTYGGTVSGYAQMDNRPDKTLCLYYSQGGAAGVIYVNDSDYSSADDFKAAMDGVYLYYELATPVETDISEYLDSNIIDVTNGTTFENEYEQAVPSTITYVVKA